MTITLADVAEQLGLTFRGDAGITLERVAPLDKAGPGELSFLADRRYRGALRDTRAGAVIMRPDDAVDCPTAVLFSDNPYAAYARAAALVQPEPPLRCGIHPSAVVAESCQVADTAWVGPNAVLADGVVLGERVQVGAGCVLEDGVTVGDDGRLLARVTLCAGTRIGKRGRFHPGAVIGSDGFGIASDQGEWIKVPQLGGVVIGDDVEIGANTTIDRGAVEDTVIADGVKIDNQVQVGHNVRIGAHTAIAGCVGIAGSTIIGRRCAIGGGVGFAGHLEVTDDVQILGMSLVTKSITRPGSYSSSMPVQDTSRWQRNHARFRQLDELARRLIALERQTPSKE